MVMRHPFCRASIRSHLNGGLIAAGSGPARSTRSRRAGAPERWPRQPTAGPCLFRMRRRAGAAGPRMPSATADNGPASGPNDGSRRRLPDTSTPACRYRAAPDPAPGGPSRQSSCPDILAAYLAAASGPKISLIHAVRRASAWAGVSPGKGGAGVARPSASCSVMSASPRRAAIRDCRGPSGRREGAPRSAARSSMPSRP